MDVVLIIVDVESIFISNLIILNIRFHDVRRFGDCKIALKGQKVRASTF